MSHDSISRLSCEVMRFAVLTVMMLLLGVANILFGAIHIAPGEVVDALTGRGDNEAIRFIIVNSRLPQALTAILCGAGLSVSGLLLQTVFRNPLAGPSILGISSGASLGVALVMLLFGGTLNIAGLSWGGFTAVIAGALGGSMLVMGCLMALSSLLKNNLMLLITGILTGYLAGSLTTLLSSLSTAQVLQGYIMWGMGTFGDVTSTSLPWLAIVVAAGLAGALLMSKPLDILMLGESYAANLGVSVTAMRNMLLLVTGILTAVITAFCGPVAFVGLAVPHIARMIFHTDRHRVLVPASMLVGAILCLSCNVASTLPADTVIPVNALTPVVGVPVILYVILHSRR